MALDFNPFYFDFATNFGVALFFGIIALAVFLWLRRSFKVSGGLLMFAGMLLLFNNINFLVSTIVFIFGIVISLSGDK